MIKEGYIAEDGTPLKCQCGCTDFEETDEYYEAFVGRVEFRLKCKKCGKNVGHWAYGNWQN